MLEKEKLETLRLQIDDVDQRILKLFQTRFKYCADIGRLKKIIGIKVADIEREIKIYENLIKQSHELNLDFKFIRKIWEIIFEKSQEIQSKSYDK